MSGVITLGRDLDSALDKLLKNKAPVKILFNQGKNVYESVLLACEASNLLFDFGGIEETSLLGLIDFGSPAVLVFYLGTTRYQFMAKSSKLVKTKQSQTCLLVEKPSSLTVIEGRKAARVQVGHIEGQGQIRCLLGGEIQEFDLKELSVGGMSMWAQSSCGLAPQSQIKSCELRIGEKFSIPCSIEIVRIGYSLDDPMGRTHLISAKFCALGSKEKEALLRKLDELGNETLGETAAVPKSDS